MGKDAFGAVARAIRQSGRILSTTDGRTTYFCPTAGGEDPDKWPEPVDIRSAAFGRILAKIGGVGVSRKGLAEIVPAIEQLAESKPIDVRHWTWAEYAEGRVVALCYAVNPRFFVRLKNGDMTFHPAADATFLAVPPPDYDPITFSALSAAWPGATITNSALLHYVVKATPPSAANRVSTNVQRVMLTSWWLGLFFDAVCEERPMMAFVGAYQSGKSTAARMFGTAFYGEGYALAGFNSGSRGIKDLIAGMAACPLYIADDLNNMPADVKDTLTRVSTGIKLQLSSFHETLAISTFRVRCNFAMTSNRPGWALRDDVMSRTIAIRLGRAHDDTQLDASVRMRRVVDARTEIYADTFKVVLRALSMTNTDRTITRFSDWERWIRRAATAGGWLKSFDVAFAQLPIAAVDLACSADDLVNALYTIAVETNKPEAESSWFTAAALFDAVMLRMGASISANESDRPSARSLTPATLGKFLADISNKGSAVVTVERAEVSHRVLWRLIPKA